MQPRIPKSLLTVLNQLYELEQKVKRHGDPANLGRDIARNITRIRDTFADEGVPAGDGAPVRLVYDDPMGQPVPQTRTDLDVTIAGPGTENLVVVEVIKPIIRAVVRDNVYQVVQQGVVVVESRTEQ